jgi:hypothetical protein
MGLPREAYPRGSLKGFRSLECRVHYGQGMARFGIVNAG